MANDDMPEPTQRVLGNWDHNECPGNRVHRTLLQAIRCQRDLAHAALHELVRLKDGPRDDKYGDDKEAAWEEARRVVSNRVTR